MRNPPKPLASSPAAPTPVAAPYAAPRRRDRLAVLTLALLFGAAVMAGAGQSDRDRDARGVQECNSRCQETNTECVLACEQETECVVACKRTAEQCVRDCRARAAASASASGSASASASASGSARRAPAPRRRR